MDFKNTNNLLKVAAVVSVLGFFATVGALFWAAKLPSSETFGVLAISLLPQAIGSGILLGKAEL